MKQLLILITALITCVPALAQKRKRKKNDKEKVPTYNYVIDDPMDTYGRQPAQQQIVKTVFLPEFFMGGPHEDRYGITLQQYYGYNGANEKIVVDTLTDYNLLRRVEHMTTNINDATRTTMYIYSKIGSDRWSYRNYVTGEQDTLQEYISKIIRTDTAGSSTSAGANLLILYKYYKVSSLRR